MDLRLSYMNLGWHWHFLFSSARFNINRFRPIIVSRNGNGWILRLVLILLYNNRLLRIHRRHLYINMRFLYIVTIRLNNDLFLFLLLLYNNYRLLRIHWSLLLIAFSSRLTLLFLLLNVLKHLFVPLHLVLLPLHILIMILFVRIHRYIIIRVLLSVNGDGYLWCGRVLLAQFFEAVSVSAFLPNRAITFCEVYADFCLVKSICTPELAYSMRVLALIPLNTLVGEVVGA